MDPEKKEQLEEPQPHPKNLKYLTTIAILFGNLTFGATFNFFSPALEDLRVKYDTSVDEISVVFTVMLISYCFGALSCGFIYKIVNRQLAVIFCLGVMALGLFFTPHCATKLQFFVVGGIMGYFIGGYDATQIVWTIEIWQDKAGPIIQAQHFCYAVGANLPSLLLGPFLMKDNNDQNGSINSTTVPYEERGSKIYIPFSIAGSLSSLACAFQIFLFLFYRYYVPPMYANEQETIEVDKEKKVEEAEEENKSKGIWNFLKSPRMKMIIIAGIYVGTYQGMEICTMQFIPTFGQYSNLKMSESDAAFVLTGLTGAFAVGRFIGIFIILKVSPVLILVGNIFLVLCGNIMLLIWANDNLTMFWASCITIGFGFSTQFASFSAFMEKHLIFTDGIGSFMIVCGSGIAAIYPRIVGKSIEENATILSYPIFFSLALGSIALAVGYWMTRGKTERH